MGSGVVVEVVGEEGGINPPKTAMGEYGYLLEKQHLSLKQIKIIQPGVKESQFYSLPFGQAVASMY